VHLARLETELRAMYTQLAAAQEEIGVLRSRTSSAESTAKHALEALAELKASPYVDPPYDTARLSERHMSRNVQELKDAHRVVILQAQALKSVLPAGATFADLDAKLEGAESAGVKKVARLLRFLRTHEARLAATLTGLPGGAHDAQQGPFNGTASLSSSAVFASRPASGAAPAPAAAAHGGGAAKRPGSAARASAAAVTFKEADAPAEAAPEPVAGDEPAEEAAAEPAAAAPAAAEEEEAA